MKNTWSSDIKYMECGDSNDIRIYLGTILRWKINILMKYMKDLEWLGYLVSQETPVRNSDFTFVDLHLPYQNVTSVSITNIDNTFKTQPYVIHSHGNSEQLEIFSTVDNEFINENNDISVLVFGDKIIATARIKTKCGLYYTRPKSIIVEPSNYKDKDGLYKPSSYKYRRFIDEINEKINVVYTHIIKDVRVTNVREFKQYKREHDVFM